MSIERVLRCCPTVSRANRSVRSVHRSAARLACLFWLLAAIPAARSLELERRAMDAARLQLAIERLPVMASVLYVAAHPDDENTALLSYLAQGELAHTTYLSITRGDGGQNLLGTEQGELLGLIRTEELLAARRIDGAEQLFTRAVDFGYTKTVEESLEYWGREEVLGDVVRAIRRLQPDVVIMRFPGDGRGGHGQHTASAVLATEGFEAAADPLRFPEQLSGDTTLGPWRPKRLLWGSPLASAAVRRRSAMLSRWMSAPSRHCSAVRSPRSPPTAGRCTRARASAPLAHAVSSSIPSSIAPGSQGSRCSTGSIRRGPGSARRDSVRGWR